MLRLIAAIDAKQGVATDQGIPWQGQLPTDAAYYREQTSHGIVVMGYGTYKEFSKPLHDRTNYVVARPNSGELRAGFVAVGDVENFLDEHATDLVWVMGGAALFAETLASAEQLYLTQLNRDFHCTKFFPEFSDAFELQSSDGPYVESDITFHFDVWRRKSATSI